jgi:endonuclease/exonuclease/phosphatase family metal-dependent hydrolase
MDMLGYRLVEPLLSGILPPAPGITRRIRIRTVGHWKNTELDKRIDGPKVTKEVALGIVSITSLDTETARLASDHLPTILEVDL